MLGYDVVLAVLCAIVSPGLTSLHLRPASTASVGSTVPSQRTCVLDRVSPLRLRGGVVRVGRMQAGDRRPAPPPLSEAEMTIPPALSNLELPDELPDDTEEEDLEQKDPLEGEFVENPHDNTIDPDYEPFLDDSDFMEKDGWDLAGFREYDTTPSFSVFWRGYCRAPVCAHRMLLVYRRPALPSC